MFLGGRARPSKRLFFKLSISTAFTVLCCFVISGSNKTPPNPWSKSDLELLRWQQETTWDKDYFVKEKGCRMPSFPVMDDSIKGFFNEAKPVVCKEALTVANDTHIWVPHSTKTLDKEFGIRNSSTIVCSVDSIVRATDWTNVIDTSRRLVFKFGEAVEVNSEFVLVTCLHDNGKSITNYHYFIAPKMRYQNTKKGKKMSVMIIGVDSVSRLHFHRVMNKTATVLNNLDAIELFGYNKIGDNTFPNLMAVLTGLEKEELKTSCLAGQHPKFDDCKFIWDDYKKEGFSTVFAEDWVMAALFNYVQPGFSQQPTDLRLRPILIEMEAKAGSQHDCLYWCLGGERTVDVLFNYLGKFVRSVGWSPYFSFFWTSTYTHDYLDRQQLIDDRMASMLLNLTSTETFEDTFLIVMSDHGIRFGEFRKTYQGAIEERLPFMFFIPPKWFPTKYPQAIYNLLSNRRSLTSPFDIHETLHDLLKPNELLNTKTIAEREHNLTIAEPLPRGISLFLPIPSTRSCSMAGISPHWCTCHERKSVDSSDPRVQLVAHDIVRHINWMLSKFENCHQLSLKSIFDAHIATASEEIGKKNQTTIAYNDVTVRLQTKPGSAEFEATSRLYADGRLQRQGSISRTNRYGSQSSCVHDYQMKLYCYCVGHKD